MGNYQHEKLLFERLKAGEEKSFDIIFKKYYRDLVFYALRFVRLEEAEDIVQTVFFKLWKNKDELDILALKAWLYVVTKNACLNSIKKIYNKEFSPIVLEPSKMNQNPLPDEVLSFSNMKKRIEQAIENLPKKCRQIFKLSREEDKTYKEIAQMLQISVKTVEYHISKSLSILHKKLDHFI